MMSKHKNTSLATNSLMRNSLPANLDDQHGIAWSIAKHSHAFRVLALCLCKESCACGSTIQVLFSSYFTEEANKPANMSQLHVQ